MGVCKRPAWSLIVADSDATSEDKGRNEMSLNDARRETTHKNILLRVVQSRK